MLPRYKSTLAGCSAALLLSPAVALANEEMSGPMEDVQESAAVIQQMRGQQDAELAARINDAKGVFVIPEYATGALLVGGSGGEGVLLTQQNGEWGNPGFYDIGNMDVGLQAGVAVGSVVMLLMTDEAVEPFYKDNDIALTAQAGLTLVNWSTQAQGNTEEADVLVWTDTEGVLAEASVGIGGMSWDEDEAREYYQQDVTLDQVLAGEVQNPHESTLRTEFAAFSEARDSSAPSDGEPLHGDDVDYGDKAAEGIDQYQTWENPESEQDAP